MKYRFVIFDVDGTLVDSETTGVLSLRKTLKELVGKDLDVEEVLPYFGLPSDKVSEIFDFPDPKALAQRWMDDFKIFAPQYLKVFSGVPELLKSIKAGGALVGIVTSRSNIEIKSDPLASGLISFCDVVVSASDTKRHKPDPEPILCAIDRASALMPGISAADCIYCGDTGYDCSAGHGAGCKFALADWKRRGLRDIPADFIYTDARECLKILEL